MKKLVHKVELIFFNDDATGDWGVTHRQTHEGINNDDHFNAFWTWNGIFHDVFEHWFEQDHKYFMNDYAMNVGGEMAAMGAMWYYYDRLGLYERLEKGRHSFYYPSQIMRNSTSDMIEEAIKCGYSNFGYSLESNVPRQRSIYNYTLESELDEYWYIVKNLKFDIRNNYSEYEFSDEERTSIEYKKSLRKSKINNLHRWGYKMAQRLVSNNSYNMNTLHEFISFFKEFTKIDAHDIFSSGYSGIDVYVYRNKSFISWDAKLVGYLDTEDIDVREYYECCKLSN